MAQIRPFVAQRFTHQAGEIGDLVAPPYDVISPEEREQLAARSEFNTVWLTLPEQLRDDRSKFVKYARSSSRLAEWRRNGVLKADDGPALYRYVQRFADPRGPSSGGGPSTALEYTRTALICLLKAEPYERGVVLPHEQTFPKHKEDRLRLLEATRSHLECIYGLYEDDAGLTQRALGEAPFETVSEIQSEDSVHHELSRCADGDANGMIAESLKESRIWIADGHHRYETALQFRNMLRENPADSRKGTDVVAEDFILIGLSSMRDPGLIILPTHRVLKDCDLSKDASAGLRAQFSVRPADNDVLADEVRSMESRECSAFGIAMPGGTGLLVTIEERKRALDLVEGVGSDLLKTLDVTILHEVILRRVFGVKDTERIEYTRDAGLAVRRVEEGNSTVAFLMNPPSVDEMRRIALGGEKMPQKSTYYYPKLLSGLVFWSLADFR